MTGSFPRSACANFLVLALLAAAPAAADDGALRQWQQKALELVNRSREAEGLSRLQLGADISQAAQAHAQDMFQRHYYAHTSPEGDDVQDRYIDAGGSRWRLAAENIARCAACRPPITAELIERFHEGWMNSPHHRENILREGLDRFGYGIKLDADQGLYAVQTFAGPGTPRRISGADEPETLSPDEVSALAAKLINRAREKAGRDKVNLDAGLRQAAESLVPDPQSQTLGLDRSGDLMNAVPAGARGQWRRLAAVSGACGGCGTEPTDFDVKYFVRQWRDERYRDRLLDSDVTDIGFALQANGSGRKVAVLVLGTAR